MSLQFHLIEVINGKDLNMLNLEIPAECVLTAFVGSALAGCFLLFVCGVVVVVVVVVLCICLFIYP